MRNSERDLDAFLLESVQNKTPLQNTTPEEKKNLGLVLNAYHILLECRKIETQFHEFFSRDLKVEKNFELAWTYEDTLQYGKKMLALYERVQFLPFVFLISSRNNYVTAQFNERFYQQGKTGEVLVAAYQFTAIFHINEEGKINHIIETACEDPSVRPPSVY